MKSSDKCSKKDYEKLKKEVNELYQVMMTYHRQNRRDYIYANARLEYMKGRNRLQKILEKHPEYEAHDPKR